MGDALQGDRPFRLLVEETSSASGMDYLRSLARNTARALGAQWAFIGRLVDGDPQQIEAVVLWERDGFGEPFVYELPGTPCAKVVAGELCHYPSGVQDLFPDDELLEQMGVEAYSGVAIANRERTFGLLAALYDRPAAELAGVEPLLWVAASRAALEIDRMEGEAEQRRLQESIQQKQKLESLGLLAGGVAHDFNNLLAAILGNAELGLMDAGAAPAQRRVLERIQSASLQAAQLTKQLLAYAGRTPFHAEPLSLADLVRATTVMLEAALPVDVTLTVAPFEALPPIEADRTQLTQVLMNLVMNASDALGEAGGEVRISAGVLEPEDELLTRGYLADPLQPVRHVFLRVEDDGVGMGDDVQAHVFDPFFTTKETGHGLGLAAALGILRRHEGTVVIDSAPGEGSAFTICLPVSRRSERGVADAAPPSTAAGLEGRRVLLVDDEPSVRKVVARVLRALGATVDEAEGGAQALALVEGAGELPDVIVLDMAMPGVDGPETLRRLRANGCHAPVVLCSGHATHSLPDEPDVSWLPKPFRVMELQDALKAALEG